MTQNNKELAKNCAEAIDSWIKQDSVSVTIDIDKLEYWRDTLINLSTLNTEPTISNKELVGEIEKYKIIPPEKQTTATMLDMMVLLQKCKIALSQPKQITTSEAIEIGAKAIAGVMGKQYLDVTDETFWKQRKMESKAVLDSALTQPIQKATALEKVREILNKLKNRSGFLCSEGKSTKFNIHDELYNVNDLSCKALQILNEIKR